MAQNYTDVVSMTLSSLKSGVESHYIFIPGDGFEGHSLLQGVKLAIPGPVNTSKMSKLISVGGSAPFSKVESFKKM